MVTPLAPDASANRRIVGGALAVNGDGVERVAGRRLQRPPQQRRRHLRVGRQEAEHRRHVRLDHAGALGHAADRERALRAVCTVTACSLGNGSVVMMARAASLPLPRASARRPRHGYPRRPCRSCSATPMTPVEATSTSSGAQPTAAAVSAAMRRACARPSSPVQALAQPLLTTIARAVPCVCSRCCCETDHRRRLRQVGREQRRGRGRARRLPAPPGRAPRRRP